jgi:hypothetical protein
MPRAYYCGMPSSAKRQHTVAQGYLRNWADPSGRVFVYDKQSGEVFHPNIRNVAVQSYFYSGSGEPPDVEAAIADIESELLPMQREILDGAWQLLDGDFELVRRIVTPERKRLLAEAIAFQFARSPMVRRLTGIPDEDKARITHIDLIARGTQYLAAEFLKYVWILGINSTATPFYTSDNPVIASPPGPDAPDPESSPPTQVVFPLSPMCLLWLWDPDSNPGQVARDGHAMLADEEDVEEANLRQVLLADRQVISATADFGVVQGFLTAT